MKLVYIASLSHSGSTVLNLSLGKHPRLIGLGEAYWVTRFSREEFEEELIMQCSCGQKVETCVYWSKVFEAVLENFSASPEEKYSILLRLFYEQFGEDAIPVDSSKGLLQLQQIREISDIDVQVLHLVRDVRPYMVSQRRVIPIEMSHDHIRRYTPSKALDIFIHLRTTRSPLYLFYKWYWLNRRIQHTLEREDIDYMQVGYEEYALHSQQTLQTICQYLDIEMDEGMLIPAGAGNHIVFGNHMLGSKKKKARIAYDNRWFYQNDWQLAAMLSPHIMRYNRRMVYQNSGK